MFTPEIDEDLLYERDEFTTSWSILAKRWGIPIAALKDRYRFLIEQEIRKDREKHAGETICITCRAKFWSEHKVNLRYCQSCREKNSEYAANMAEDWSFGR